jgi:serine/threonine-protein kinase
MGELYLAKWAGFDGRTVVIRVFPQGFEENTEDMHRFLRGNEAGGEIRHPNLIRLYRGGRTPNPWRGRRVWWLAMEYLSGGSLRDRLVRATEPLPVSEVVQIGRDLCEALGEIANRRLVHRNINPSCILLTESRQAKLGDFFLLRSEVFESIHQATQADLPQSEYVYHPPEQLDGVHELDGSSDIYSLACCLYEALTLTPPFNPNQSLPAIFQAIRTQDVVPPREINPAVAPALQNVLLQAMHKDPTRRPGSPQELLEQLTNLTQ